MDVLGREEELASLRAFLRPAGRRASRNKALVLEGEAGIGKSTCGSRASKRRASEGCAFSSFAARGGRGGGCT